MARVGRGEAWWRELLEDWRRSGKPVKRFCVERAVARSAFYRWRKRLSEAGDVTTSERPVRFAPVRLRSRECVALSWDAFGEPGNAGVEIVTPSGYRVRLQRGFDHAALGAAIAVLEGRSC